MSSHAVAYINQSALQHNLACIRQLAPDVRVLAMIKSNAYGHGLQCVARQLSDADAFGVASLEEALQLREAGIRSPLVVMSGFLDAEQLQLFHQYHISAVIHQHQQLQLLEKHRLPIPLWLKFDSGMHRLGFALQEVDNVYRRVKNILLPGQSLVVMTHLSSADCCVDYTRQQIQRFTEATSSINHPKSIANSAGILNFKAAHSDWIRPGGLLYGSLPSTDRTGSDYGLQPVMTLKSRLIAVKNIDKGASVGYGASWQSPTAMTMGVVAIGYGDGYPRHAPSGTPTLINGQICPVVGRVSMDMLCVDLRNSPQVKTGDEVTLWGEGLPVEQIAVSAGTIAYELLCGLAHRVKLEVVEEVLL